MTKTTLAGLVAALILCTVALLFLHFRPTPQAPKPPPAIESLDQGEAWRRFKSGEKVVLLDVRQPEEIAEISIPGSVLVPLNPPATFLSRAREAIPDTSVPVFVICRSGQRSLSAAEIMANGGYRTVYNIGGILDWKFDAIRAPAK